MKFVLASNNRGKLKEFQAAFAVKKIDLIPQSEFNTPEVEETGLSFIENAIIKARHACGFANLPALADDSGIAVDALNGEPGIYSARYAGVGASDADNRQKLLAALNNIADEQRTARFVCALVLMQHAHDPCPLVVQTTWAGKILLCEQGDQGFGYDPLFFVPSHQCSAAELSMDVKNQISHRGQAIGALFQQI